MKLSDAIRLGSMLSPPGSTGCMLDETRCAIAAASDAAGIPALVMRGGRHLVNYTAMEERFPILSVTHRHPVYGCQSRVMEIVWSLNDCLLWPRYQIADWIESVERAHARHIDGNGCEAR